MAKVVERADLFCKAGSKDAVYHMEIVETDGGYLVNYRNGRAGGTLTPGSKTPTPLPTLEAARKVMDKTVKEKLKASPPYQLMEATGSSFTQVQADVAGRATGLLPQLLNEIDTEDPAAVAAVVNDDFYCIEQKADGERRMLRSLGDGSVPIGSNRKGQEVPLPLEIANSVAHIRCTLDGEIIGSQFYAFDILELNGTDLRGERQEHRKAKLHGIGHQLGRGITILPAAHTKAEKMAMIEMCRLLKQEGVVAKDITAPYTEGRPNSGGPQLKLKNWAITTVIVVKENEGKRSVVVAVVDGQDQLVEVGSVTIPQNAVMPEPGTFMEVRYLYAFPQGALFEATFRRVRADHDRSHASIGKLKYKADHVDVAVPQQHHARIAA